MLRTRILTAVVLLAVFAIATTQFDRAAFAGLVALVVLAGAWEWGRLAGLGTGGSAFYAIACAAGFAGLQLGGGPPALAWIAGTFWIVVVPLWLRAGVRPGPAALAAAGVVVLVPAGVAMASLSRWDLLCVLGLTWVADTGAYFAGRAWGRRKLAPTVSPGKTWEGVAGGAAGCLAYVMIWAALDPSFRARVEGGYGVPLAACTLLLCAVSVIGDLFESALKRQAGAKDSGRLLPGHGGVLDRIDSATAALPVALLLLQATGAR